MDTQTSKTRTIRGTHSELTDSTLRLILANELLVLRSIARKAKKLGCNMDRASMFFIREGLDTALRRVEDVQKNGMEVVYRQNYVSKVG